MEGAAQIPSTTETQGFRLQRHVDAINSAATYFTPASKMKASVSTGITMEYVVVTKDVAGATKDEHVVMIMGFGMTKEAWSPVIDQFVTRWVTMERNTNLKLLAFDNRGVGRSDVPWGRYTTTQMANDTLALMDHLEWSNAHVMGTSMGGMISLELASIAPIRVKSLSLLVTTRGNYTNDHGNATAAKTLLATDTSVIVDGLLSMLYPDEFLAHRMVDKEGTVRDVLSKFYRERVENRPRSMVGTMGQLLAIQTHFVSDDRLAEIGRAGFPVLILGGGCDRLIPGRESHTLGQHITGDHVKVTVFQNAGHGLHIQLMDEVAEALIATFIKAEA